MNIQGSISDNAKHVSVLQLVLAGSGSIEDGRNITNYIGNISWTEDWSVIRPQTSLTLCSEH
jgi:hypothetical protein